MQSQLISSNTPNHVATRFHDSQNVSRSVTMSSQEITDLVGARHDSVKRTIERLAEKGVIQIPPMVEKPTGGRPSAEYVFSGDKGKRDSIVVVAQLSPEFTATLVDRWQELEERSAKPVFDYAAALNDPRTLLALLTQNVTKVVALEADNTELSHENLMLEQKVAADAPKTAFFDAVTVTHETYSVAEAAKLIGTGQNRLMAFLRQRRWVTIRKNEPMQSPIESGYLTAKLSTFEHPENGKTTVSTPRVTGKGLTKLQALWARRDADLLGGAL
ncbi:phage antirepressor KilAC domain-containing protein [Pseudomonas brassicacearum]|uniref:DNA-binding protein n=1 Tax=Pseudomonas brassicacearum TaxID=930166 RepID=A0A423GP04_9PSED|nr:phage antirepressor KilAC domain-containing protein [Pseudomonas brassicacearum]ROM94415.1 DNA-binding protein [Pseudomonas brassicacearum]